MAELGLNFDLSLWKKGIRDAAALTKQGLSGVLSPFDAAVKKSLGGLRGSFGAAFKGLGGFVSGALGPIAALASAGAIIEGIRRSVVASYKAWDDYADSVEIVKAALGTIPEVNIGDATKQVEGLGDMLRASLGIIGAETNKAFATFITRGFDTSQARQLTILAANYAKKTGKPLEEVAMSIGDAANGQLKSIKALGLQVSVTGNRVVDAQNAVLALKDAYATIGTDLVDPHEQLMASLNAIAVMLGERIAPVIEPIVRGIADFVTGLSRTEQGRQALDAIGKGFGFVADSILRGITFLSNWWKLLFNGGKFAFNFVKYLFSEVWKIVASFIAKLPGGEQILKSIGMDKLPETLADSAGEAVSGMADALKEGSKAVDGMFSNTAAEDSVAGFFKSQMEAGRKIREDETQKLNEEMAATQKETFAGKPGADAQAEIDRKAGEAAEKKRVAERAKANGVLAKRAKAFGDAEEGQRVSVTIVSRRPDRFRKARSR